MEVIKKHNPGTFCWVELATSDSEKAKQFYRELFGWEAIDQTMGDGGVYTMFKLDGKEVGAMYQLDKNHSEVPPHWLAYISVDNIDDTVKKVVEAGGTTCVGPFDVSTAGRMAVITAPEGEYFGVWQPKDHIGTKVKNVPGSYCWNELGIRDDAKARKFYTEVFGWSSKKDNFGPIEYTTYKVAEEPVGGMYVMTADMEGIPAHWLTYFVVEDCDKSCKLVEDKGGSVAMPPQEIPGIGRFAVVQDPQGAVMGLIKPG